MKENVPAKSPNPGEGLGRPPTESELLEVHGERPDYLPEINLITEVPIEDETKADEAITELFDNQPQILTNAAINEEDVVAIKRRNKIIIASAAAGAGLAAIALGIGAKKIYDHKKAMADEEKKKEAGKSRGRKFFTKVSNLFRRTK